MNSFIPLLVNSVYRDQNEEAVRQYSIIFYVFIIVVIQKALLLTLSTTVRPLEESQRPIYQSLHWANLNEHMSLQVEVS